MSGVISQTKRLKGLECRKQSRGCSSLSRDSPERILHGQRARRAPGCHQRQKEPIKGCAEMKRITHPDPQYRCHSTKTESIVQRCLMGPGESCSLPHQPRDTADAKYTLNTHSSRLVEQGFHWLMLLLGESLVSNRTMA